jgi:hypothetical protein
MKKRCRCATFLMVVKTLSFVKNVIVAAPTSRMMRCATFSPAYIIPSLFYSSGQFSFLLVCPFP